MLTALPWNSQMQQMIDLEETRRLALLLTPLALLGPSIGPFLVSFALRPGGR